MAERGGVGGVLALRELRGLFEELFDGSGLAEELAAAEDDGRERKQDAREATLAVAGLGVSRSWIT